MYTVLNHGDEQVITVFVPGEDPLVAHSDHPNFGRIKAACEAGNERDALGMLDLTERVTEFLRLSARLTVRGGKVFFDGDEVEGVLVETILDHIAHDEDVEPLVNFFEKLSTNPLGDVREGIFAWMMGQKREGNFTITEDGNVLGYKSTTASAPEWREGEEVVYVPSRRGAGVVNDREVARGEYIEQVPGDTVEMPRSKVLHAPSQACGDGLHIGTWNYAKGFTGDTVLLVEFDPRDVVSVPDSNADWKLRVCRYYVVGTVTEPLEVPVYRVPESAVPSALPVEDDEYDEFGVDDEYDLFYLDD